MVMGEDPDNSTDFDEFHQCSLMNLIKLISTDLLIEGRIVHELKNVRNNDNKYLRMLLYLLKAAFSGSRILLIFEYCLKKGFFKIPILHFISSNFRRCKGVKQTLV